MGGTGANKNQIKFTFFLHWPNQNGSNWINIDKLLKIINFILKSTERTHTRTRAHTPIPRSHIDVEIDFFCTNANNQNI